MIKIRRIYQDDKSEDNSYRVLVDRLWPRGISKEQANLDEWMKNIAPSDDLREWFSHDIDKWQEFKAGYKAELKNKTDLLKELKDKEKNNDSLVLLYAAKDKKHNNAVVLKKVLDEM